MKQNSSVLAGLLCLAAVFSILTIVNQVQPAFADTSVGNMPVMSMMKGTTTDGSEQVIVTYSPNPPASGQPLSITLTFTDAQGNPIHHQNYAISVTQDGNEIFSNIAGHTHTGNDMQTTNSLSSSNPVGIKITLNGIGLPGTDPSTWTGPKNEAVIPQIIQGPSPQPVPQPTPTTPTTTPITQQPTPQNNTPQPPVSQLQQQTPSVDWALWSAPIGGLGCVGVAPVATNGNPTVDEQTIQSKMKEILSSITVNFNSSDDVPTLIYKGKAFGSDIIGGQLITSFYYFDKALQLDPHNVEAQTGKDITYNKIHCSVSRLMNDIQTLQKYPDSGYMLLGDEAGTLGKLQKYDDALTVCDRVLQLPIPPSGGGCKLGVLLYLHKYDDLLKLSETFPSSGSSIFDGRIISLYNLGKYDELITYLDTLSILHTNQQYGGTQWLFYKALTLEKMGKNDQANSIYDAMGFTVSNQQDLYYSKGMDYFYLQDYDKAVYYFEKLPQNIVDGAGYMKVIAYDELAKESASNKIRNTLAVSPTPAPTNSQSTPITPTPISNATPEELASINDARNSQTIAAEVNVGANQAQTTSIDNNVSVQTTMNNPDSLESKVSAPDQTGPKVIMFNLPATTINVANLNDLGITYDGQLIAPASNIDAILHAKSTDSPSFVIVVTQSGVQVLVLVPHFSTHTITITNMSKVTSAVPEFPFALFTLVVATFSIILVSRIRLIHPKI